ncbi:MAG TPA: ABC transporter substrate-binding protein [Burkholderiaceae bacterium]|nr:ABC transporter substrate-binding protein [Burkholderiaceae bacterium]
MAMTRALAKLAGGKAALVLLFLLFAQPLTVVAQPAAKIFRVGLLGTVPLTNPEASRIWGGFFDGLQQLGYIEGQNIVIESRFSDGISERLPALAAELVQLRVDVIVAAGHTPSVARSVTSTIPIVMPNHGDPIASGLVVTLARPGGNVTGLSAQTPELLGKQLQLLQQVLPRMSRVAVLSNPGNPNHARYLRNADDAAQSLKVRLQILEARAPSDIVPVFSAATRESAHALLVLGDPMFTGQIRRIGDLAIQSRLPAIANQSEYADAGVLLTYGVDLRESFHRAATYVDRILKGTRPSDLPVEQPTKFELVVNRRVATTLGVAVPPALLVQAQKIID